METTTINVATFRDCDKCGKPVDDRDEVLCVACKSLGLQVAAGPGMTVSQLKIEIAKGIAPVDYVVAARWIEECQAVVVAAPNEGETTMTNETANQVLAVTTDGVQIEAGEYIVSGATADDLDYGQVWLDDDGRVMASWGTGNGYSSIANRAGEIVPGVHGVYTTLSAARAGYEERFAELSRA